MTLRPHLAIVALMFTLPAHASSVLYLSHLQSIYAGGGGCLERFWLEWQGDPTEITNIEIAIELVSRRDEPLTAVFRVERLGATTADRADEARVETARCLSGNPRIIVRSATGVVAGNAVNLIRDGSLQIAKVVHRPMSIAESK